MYNFYVTYNFYTSTYPANFQWYMSRGAFVPNAITHVFKHLIL